MVLANIYSDFSKFLIDLIGYNLIYGTIFIIFLTSKMASYQDKIQGSKKSTHNVPRHSKRLISLDDGDQEQSQKPNVFSQFPSYQDQSATDIRKQAPIGKRKQTIMNNINSKSGRTHTKLQPIMNKKQIASPVSVLDTSQSKLFNKNKLGLPQESKPRPAPKIQTIQQQYPDQTSISDHDPQIHGVSKKSWLNLFQSINLQLGNYFYSYNFPIRRQIPIIANNLDLQREKYENGTYISQSFDNNLQIPFYLYFLRVVVAQNFLRLSTLLWIVAIILSYVIDTNEQYRPGKQILLGMFIFSCVLCMALQYMSTRQRRNWVEPSSGTKYRVYHYNNQYNSAEWVYTSVSQLRPGNIYKLPAPSLYASVSASIASIIPADSILLHSSNRSIIQVDQSPIIEYLSPLEKEQRIGLKETLLKQQNIVLPLTGVIHYQLAAPEIGEDNVYGKFMMQEPAEKTVAIGYENVLLRGSRVLGTDVFMGDEEERENRIKNRNRNNININKQPSSVQKQAQPSQEQIYLVVLETGIDSLVLKTSQYPYQYRPSSSYTTVMDMLLILLSLIYLLVVGTGILIGYIYIANKNITHGYHIDNYIQATSTSTSTQPIGLGQIVLHHFGNFIMIVPVLMRVCYLIYVNVVGRMMESKLEVKCKDRNTMMDVCACDVMVTTIGGDLVKMGKRGAGADGGEGEGDVINNQQNIQDNIFDPQQSQPHIAQLPPRPYIHNRSLQSIRVSGIHHNFLTTPINSQLYTTKDIDMLCYFMSIALLTCSRKNPSPLEGGIVERCSKELNIKIEKLGLGKRGDVLKIGQLKVIRMFTIPATEEYPYKIVFYAHGKDIVQDIEDAQHKNASIDPSAKNTHLQVKDIQQRNRDRVESKILCLVRGQTTKLTKSMAQGDGQLLNQFSNRLHQEKGYHVQLLGKFVLSYQQFVQIKKAYTSTPVPVAATTINPVPVSLNNNNLSNEQQQSVQLVGVKKYTISQFYGNLNKFMAKIDPMGILIWQNPYSIISSSISTNNISSGSNMLSPISSLQQFQYKIIISPPSKSHTNPQFESIHAITNYLLKTSGLPLKEISNKILHNYINKQTFWECLSRQKILVLNGWDYRMIKNMLIDIKDIQYSSSRDGKKYRNKKKSLKLLGYIEQDQYAWVLKQTHISISTKGDGYDLQKYSDIIINNTSTPALPASSSSPSAAALPALPPPPTSQIIHKLFIYTQSYGYSLNNIIIIQFMKGILLATIQFIYCFYTWGTGLVLIGSPLYLLLEIGVMIDVLYYMFVRIEGSGRHNSKGKSKRKNRERRINKEQTESQEQRQRQRQRQREKSLPSRARSRTSISHPLSLTLELTIFQLITAIFIGIFITFIPIYSMTQPPTSSGTVQPKQFTHVLIHFILYHILIFRKLFMYPYRVSVYKLFIIAVQIGVYYIGLVIISAVDGYAYKGVIWYVIKGKVVLVGIFMVWMVVCTFWLMFVIEGVVNGKSMGMDSEREKDKGYAKIDKLDEKMEEKERMDDKQELKNRRVGQVIDIQ